VKTLFAIMILVVINLSFAQSETALLIERELGLRVEEEAVSPDGDRYILITQSLSSAELNLLRPLLIQERPGYGSLSVVYPGIGSRYRVIFVRSTGSGWGSSDWYGKEGLEITYSRFTDVFDGQSFYFKSRVLPTPQIIHRGTAPANASRPRGTSDSCEYVSTSNYTTYTCYNNSGLATYRNYCTISYVNGVYRSSCTTSRW
jgi:hypothetical protein